MSDDTETFRKGRGVSVPAIVSNIILLMSCGLLCWTAQQVIADGKVIATHSTQIEALENRALFIEARTIAQTETLADIKVIHSKLINIEKSQERIEGKVDKHVDSDKPNKP